MENRKYIDSIVGTWYSINDDEVYSTLSVHPLFFNLPEETVNEVIAAHDEFKEKLYTIFKALPPSQLAINFNTEEGEE